MAIGEHKIVLRRPTNSECILQRDRERNSVRLTNDKVWHDALLSSKRRLTASSVTLTAGVTTGVNPSRHSEPPRLWSAGFDKRCRGYRLRPIALTRARRLPRHEDSLSKATTFVCSSSS